MSKETAKKIKEPKDEDQTQNSLAVWLRLQRSLAEKNDVTLTTLSRDGAAIGRIENDNSICQAMRISSEYSALCASDCANAYSDAVRAGQAIEYHCHAGLHCFAVPVKIDKQQLVILGGRAFTSTYEYTQFFHRYKDLDAARSGECLSNIKFLDKRELRQAADLVASTAQYHFQSAHKPIVQPAESVQPSSDLLDARQEITRLSDQLENRNRSISKIYNFLHTIASTLDSHKVYASLLAKFSQIMKAERSSLMILNEQSNELALEAALGFGLEGASPIRVKLGEGIAGAVLATGSAMLVHDVDTDERMPAARRQGYKTKSFISFPIAIGSRKVGVLNLTDRFDGAGYCSDDLSLLELVAPHLALIIDRTEWHKKAEAYQRMSLTDALTGLPNRRYLEERLFEEVERSKRHDTPLSFMLIDLDHFKSYNDLYGHTNADRVLVKTAQVLRRSVRTIDMSARFAGDEFCIVMPETRIADAARIAERLRQAVSQSEYRSEQGGLMDKVTLSIGVSSFSPSRQSPLAIIETADRALYQAKTRGRNCVAVYEDSIAAR